MRPPGIPGSPEFMVAHNLRMRTDDIYRFRHENRLPEPEPEPRYERRCGAAYGIPPQENKFLPRIDFSAISEVTVRRPREPDSNDSVLEYIRVRTVNERMERERIAFWRSIGLP